MIEHILNLIEKWQYERGYQCIVLDEENVREDLEQYLEESFND